MDVNDQISRMLFGLHAAAVSDLAWWFECELITWLDEGVKRIARTTTMFVTRDTSITLVSSQAQYSLPQRHVATLFIYHDNLPLIPTSTSQLELLDAAYQSAAPGTPVRFTEDKQGLGTFSLYPAPDATAATKTLAIIMLQYPPTLDCQRTQTTVTQPTVVDDYAQSFSLSRALKKDSDGSLIEVGDHLAERFALYEAICQSYWSQG